MQRSKGDEMEELVTLGTMAVIVEALVEYTTFKLPKQICPSWAKFYAGLIIGITLCVIYNCDLMPLLGMEAIPIVGPVITGLLIGRGSNVTNDLFKRLQVVQVPAAKTDDVIGQGVVMPPAQTVLNGREA
jgi:hypothetical protein